MKMVDLKYGPLNKSLFTQQLELVAHCIIQVSNKIKFHTEYTTNKHTALYVTIDNIEINLSALFKKANFTHISLPEMSNHLTTENHDHLTASELAAIKNYTGSGYYHTNSLLHDNPPWYEVKPVVIDTLYLASGLNKIIPFWTSSSNSNMVTYRGESATPAEEIESRIKLVQEGGGITETKAFKSTSTNYDTADLFKSNCIIKFDALYGKDLSKLSIFPEENEYLLPPSQILWEGYEKQGNTHVFHAKVVAPLIEGKDNPTPGDIEDFLKLLDWAKAHDVQTNFLTPHLLTTIGKTLPLSLEDVVSTHSNNIPGLSEAPSGLPTLSSTVGSVVTPVMNSHQDLIPTMTMVESFG